MRKSAVAFVLVLAACSGGGTETEADSANNAPEGEQSAPPETQASVDESSSGGEGSITVIIGDMTWEFDTANCRIIEGVPGEEDSVWDISTPGNFQVVLTYGNSSSMDIGGGPFAEDLENDWDSEAPDYEVNGSTVIGTGTFTNRTNDEIADGTVTAVCPDWG